MKSYLPPYIGGKATLCHDIIALMPPHKVYCEGFGGFASVLLNKRPAAWSDFYNDVNGDISNLFKVLRDDFDALAKLLKFTEYGRAVFAEAAHVLKSADAPNIRRAWAVIVMHEFAIKSIQRNPSFGNGGAKYEGSKAVTWQKRKATLLDASERLQSVIIENKPALELCASLDTKDTLFYLDPPYPFEVRTGNKMYKHELNSTEHEDLIEWCLLAKGKVMLSSYRNSLYDTLLNEGWTLTEFAVRTNMPRGSRCAQRVEALYINPAAQLQNSLF